MTETASTINCPNPVCGIPVTATESSCPKCDTPLHDAFSEQYYEIDVAHSSQTREEARLQIEEGLNYALLYRYKGLKVIHGYGGANRNRGVIAKEAKWRLQDIADRKGYELEQDRHNPGAHILNFDR